jgi:DNA-binding response OmpR family regulator
MSAPTQSAAVLVYEREPYWTPELQRRLADEPVVVRSCGRLSDLDVLPAGFDHSVVILDLTADPAGCLAWLARRRANAPVVALGPSELAELEATFRSVGVTSFQTGAVANGDLARLCRRWLRT